MNLKYFKLIKERSNIIFYIFLLIIFFIWINFFILQIYFKEKYKIKSKLNFTQYKKTESFRGAILDKNNKLMASTRPFLKIYWNKYPLKFSEEDERLFEFLKKNINENIDKEFLTEKNSEKKICIKDKIIFSELSLILENFPSNNRIEIKIYTKRNYPLGSFACHTIGYLNSIEKKGTTGLEKIYEKNLSGEEGLKEEIVNASGKILDSKILNEAITGKNIKTTIDIDIQKILEEIFPEDAKGCAIVMNPENGALLGVLSSPRFDPSIFLNKIDKDVFDKFNEKSTLINRCFNATYPPGSIFKIISSIAMLEEKIISKDTNWFCSGFIDYKGRKYNCSFKNGHGKIDIKNALCYSCNIPYFESSKKELTINLIEKYALIFGFGKTTDSVFSEKSGLIPSPKWKRQRLNEKWYTGETLSVSIGQGALQVTPIQIVCFISSIMTGYLVKPRILEEENVVKNKINISNETLSIIRESILLGSRQGSSKALNSLKDFEIYAKTGTAQLRSRKEDIESDEEIKNKKLHGLITCYVKCKKNKKMDIALVILIEENSSGFIATKYAKDFLKKYLLLQ